MFVGSKLDESITRTVLRKQELERNIVSISTDSILHSIMHYLDSISNLCRGGLGGQGQLCTLGQGIGSILDLLLQGEGASINGCIESRRQGSPQDG